MKQFFTFLFSCIFLQNILTAQTNTFVTYNAANTSAFANTGNNFKCVAVGDSAIWAGTQYKGLYKYDTVIKVWVQSSQLTNVFINDIKADKNGGIWVAQSGTSGLIGGGSSIAGGINYFPGQYDYNMIFYSVPGTTTGGGLTSRNVRAIYIDSVSLKARNPLPRVWAAEASYFTSGNTASGGISIGLNPTADYFTARKKGLDVYPFGSGTPSCDAVGGDKKEVWVSVRQNFGKSQILRYNPSILIIQGAFLGFYDNTNSPLPAGFRAQAIFFDSDGRRWIGLQNGGLLVMQNNKWTVVNMSDIFPAGTTINNNAITEDDLGQIYIGTNNGIVVFDGGGNVDDQAFYKKFTTTDGLPSNNITGVAYDRKNGRMILSSDAGITFWNVNNKIDVTLQWDYSFPDRTGKPRGVAADGVSRVYLKIRNGDNSLPAIKDIKVSLDEYDATDSTIRGRLKNAVTLDAYSEEASVGASKEATLNSPNVITSTGSREFWFWYVSPEDFSEDSLGNKSNLSIRSDNLKVLVNYVNNTKDSTIYKMKVVRPPLLLVHGLASGPATFKDFYANSTDLFINSDRFKYVRALVMDGKGAFQDNANLLTSGDLAIDTAADRINTLQGNIEQIRNLRYACNQVDYVCHSMGGIMIRYAIERYHNKFYAGAGYKYKNYQKGFTHKIIFVNTPHNSSPIADAVYEWIPLLPDWMNKAIGLAYLNFPDAQIPFNFVEPVDVSKILTLKGTTFRATPAVRDLQVTDAQGGVNLGQTKTKFHMITGNVGLLSAQTTTTFAALDPTFKYVNEIIESMLKSTLIPPNIKSAVLTPMLNVSKVTRALSFWEWFSKNKGYPDFLAESDLIVPLASESARIPLPGAKKYITAFDNSPGSIYDASHVTILARRDVGKKVFDLLNTKVSGPAFGDVIPANTDPEPGPLSARPALQKPLLRVEEEGTFYDTSKIKIDFPSAGSTIFADSLLNIKFRLKDSANLAYVHIRFQDNDTFSLNKTRSQQTTHFTIMPEYPGKQLVWAVAAYFTPDNSIIYHIDTFNLSIDNKAVAQGFRINDSDIVVKGNRPYYAPYQVLYNSTWTNLPNNDSLITVSFDPAGIVKFDDTTKAFVALQDGITSVTVNYKNFSTTVLMQTEMPLSSFCINRTIAAGNFKNPAIWSKSVVPDICDSAIIQHAVTLDTSMHLSSLRINAGASLTINNSLATLQLGSADDGRAMIDNYGTLNITHGNVNVQGRVKLSAGSTFNMTGGKLKIDGNTGFNDTALPDSLSLFEASPTMQQFSFTGDTLQIVDPPYGEASQAINCPYNFGPNSILVLGDGISTTASTNPDGFGGTSFPNMIGNFILNASSASGNRQFITKKPLIIKGYCKVKTGSNLIQQASLQVIP